MIKLAREQGIRVVDIMTKDLFVIRSDTPLAKAAALLSERRIIGAPVVSASTGKPVGVVSRADLVDPGRQALGSTVETAMTRILYGVRPTDPAISAVGLMVNEKIHRVIVVDGNGKLVGIVTAMDILRSLVHAGPKPSVPLEWVPLA